MCVKPSYIYVERDKEWHKMPKACGDCWRCRQNRVNDYVGRSLAEAAFSDWVVTVTLTYAPRDDLADKILTPRHFQRFIRSLRRRGHKIRYLVAGEYGELRGRAHFHAILFGKGPRPRILKENRTWPHGERCWVDEWPHGHVLADWRSDERSIRYVCKYLQKQRGRDQMWFSLSKKPTLGAEFFANKAASAVRLGVLPSGFEYMPPGGNRKAPYLMTGATRRDYMRAVIDGWERHRPLDDDRLSEWVRNAYEADQRRQYEAFKDALPLEEKMADLQKSLDNRRISETKAKTSAAWLDFYEQENERAWHGEASER